MINVCSFLPQGDRWGVKPTNVYRSWYRLYTILLRFTRTVTVCTECPDRTDSTARIAHIGRLKLTGLVAWLAWLFVHVLYLIGFRNRAVVILNWAWAYVRRQRGARLIYGDVNNLIRPDRKREDEPAAELANRN